MEKKYFFGVIFMLLYTCSFAQGEADNWFFGANAGVNFSTGAPTYVAGGQINTLEGCASISDTQGSLLFYTDGISVWNKNHSIMPNGTGLNGDPSSTSSALIVPSPGDSNIYYVFTVDEPHHDETAASNHGLNYSVIDMSLIGGDGDVIAAQKNIPLVTYDVSNSQENKYKCSEKITAVRSGDCNSFWVVTHFINNYYSFKVDGAGVDANPVISTTPVTVPLSGYRRNSLGYLKASPEGDKLAVAHQGFATTSGGNAPGGVFLYDFDPITGVVSNELEVYNRNNGNSPYGVEFSRSGGKLYATVGGGSNGAGASQLIQYDLTSTDIIASETIINETNSYHSGAIQLASNGKIYRALFNFNSNNGSYLAVINDPELIGAASNYVEQGFSVDNPGTGVVESSRIGLPPFIQSLFAQKVDIINNDNDPVLVSNTLILCEDEVFTLSAEDIVNATYIWTLDGNPITNTTFNLVDISVSGTYLVEVIPNNGDCPFFGEAIVSIFPLPIINTITPLEACFDTVDGLNDFTLSDADAEALIGQLSSVSVMTYHSNSADAISGNNPISIIYSSIGETIYIRLLNTDTGCVNAVPVELIVNPLPVVTSPVALEQCDDDTDGITTFNLSEANVLLSVNSATETFSYFTSLANAQSNTNLIISFTNYSSSTGTTIHVRITSDKGCVSYGEVNLVVGTTQIPSSFSLSYEVCDNDGDGDGYNGVSTFDFSTATAQIMNLFPVGQNITVSYFQNQNDALAEINAIVDSSNYQNTSSPNTQSIWVRVDSQDLNGCLGLGEHITLTVNPLPAHNILDEIVGCSDTNTASFDLSNATFQALNGVTDVTITYHETLAESELGTNVLASPYTSIATTLFIRAENNSTGCYMTSMSVNLIVNPKPDIVAPTTVFQVCDNGSLGNLANFDFTSPLALTIINEIIQGNTTYAISFFQTLANAQANTNQIGTNYNDQGSQTVFVRVEDVLTNCVSYQTMSLEVVARPTVYSFINPLIYCDTDNDNIGYFDLNTIVFDISGGLTTVTVTFFETEAEADLGVAAIDTSVLYENVITNNDGDNNPATQTIFAQLSIPNVDCTTLVAVKLHVLRSPVLPNG
ncbi:MAG: CUB protein, partial [Kordia sp.]